MIRLKSLLEQTTASDKNKDNVPELPNVLFVGDAYTKSKSSYANRLISADKVNGKIIAHKGINIKQLVKLVKRYVNNSYSIVSVMFGDIVTKKIDITIFKQQLIELENAATARGAKLIVIQNTNKRYSKYQEFVDAISDIDANIIYTNSELESSITQSKIVKSWVNTITDTLNIEMPSVGNDILDRDTEKSDTDQENPADKIPTKHVHIPGTAKEFINQWISIAKEHQTKYGIPASITLAQGGLESAWGKSGLATKYNNYFGITGKYKGNTVNLRDSGGSMLNFRVYPTPNESYEDHAQLLKRKYTPETPDATYTEWANTLQQNGYATNPSYAESLIQTIEKFGLNDYDTKTKNASMKLSDIYKGTLKAPVAGGRDFGMKLHPIKNTMQMHWGIDYSKPSGTPIIVAKEGQCILSAISSTAGEWVKIKHDNGTVTTYMHLSQRMISQGDDVKVGSIIGLVGTTGASTGPHLHWEYQPEGSADPEDGKSVANQYFAFGNENSLSV